MDRRTDIMRHFPRRLTRWRGSHARLWSLTSSHPTLTILLTKDGVTGGLMIVCTGPERIEAPRSWENSDIQVELDTRSLRLVDRGANVLISECSVELKEFDLMEWEKPPKHGANQTTDDTST